MNGAAGGSLADLCDLHRAPVLFSCRDANCGSCRVLVVSGTEELSAPGAEERSVLDRLGAARSERLACQVQLRAGTGLVCLRTVRHQ